MQEVDLSIHYHPGKKNVIADALSHLPVRAEDGTLVPEESLVASIGGSPQENSKSGEDSLGDRQRGDAELRQIIEYLETGTMTRIGFVQITVCVDGWNFALHCQGQV